jgi:hypothetical protein
MKLAGENSHPHVKRAVVQKDKAGLPVFSLPLSFLLSTFHFIG